MPGRWHINNWKEFVVALSILGVAERVATAYVKSRKN